MLTNESDLYDCFEILYEDSKRAWQMLASLEPDAQLTDEQEAFIRSNFADLLVTMADIQKMLEV